MESHGPADGAALRWLAWEGARRAWLEDKGGPTRRVYSIAWQQFMAWAGVPPWRVSPRLARAWAHHLAGQGLAPATLHLKLAALSSFYHFVGRVYRLRTPQGHQAGLWRAGRPNPFRRVPRPRLPAGRRARQPSPADVRAMLANINPACLTGRRDFALLLTLVVAGRPAPQVLAMAWGDLNPLDTGDCLFTCRGAGGARTQVVLPATCYQAICAYLEMDGRPPDRLGRDDTVFLPLNVERASRLSPPSRQPNQPLSASFANRILKKYARRAGVDPARAHLRGLCRVGARLRALVGTRVDQAWLRGSQVRDGQRAGSPSAPPKGL